MELQIIEYSDYVQPNTGAWKASDLDANFFQHKPYMDDFNEEQGTQLVSVGLPSTMSPSACTPARPPVPGCAALMDGAKVAVPNDTTNEARALLLLQSNGHHQAEGRRRPHRHHAGHRGKPQEARDR